MGDVSGTHLGQHCGCSVSSVAEIKSQQNLLNVFLAGAIHAVHFKFRILLNYGKGLTCFVPH